jgi:hypothetical protein
VVRFLPFLISLGLSLYALFSCIQTRDEDVPYLPKLVWIVLIVLVPFVGPLAWLLVSRTPGLRPQRAPVGGRPGRGRVIRPVAPDDDPDFLASLERHRDPRLSDPRVTRRSGKPTKPVKDSGKEGGKAKESGANESGAKDSGAKDSGNVQDAGQIKDAGKTEDAEKAADVDKADEVAPEDKAAEAESPADDGKPKPDDGSLS